LYNYRAAFIISGGVCLVSLIIGLLGGAFFFAALLRALVFAGVFFGLTAGIHYLWNKFMQPSETADTGSAPVIGRNIDYTVTDDDLFGIQVDEILPPGNASAETEDSASGGLEALLTADTGGYETVEPAGASGEALEQNGDNVYIDNRAPAAETPTAAKVAADYAFDIDMSGFTPAMPSLGGGWEADKTVSPPGGADGSQTTNPDAGIVDMSVTRKSGTKLDMYTNADGKEMAGAIKTLLRKDEG
jgi:hypothetical protein